MDELAFIKYSIFDWDSICEGTYVIKYKDDGGVFFRIAGWDSKLKVFYDVDNPKVFFSRILGYKLLKKSSNAVD